MSAYPFLLLLHLFAAIVFAGAVFFEVLMLEGVRRHLPRETMVQVERAIADRARRIMPWVLLILYGAGIGMAVRSRELLAQPLGSSFVSNGGPPDASSMPAGSFLPGCSRAATCFRPGRRCHPEDRWR